VIHQACDASKMASSDPFSQVKPSYGTDCAMPKRNMDSS
jgi:hypothetical protein